MSLLFKELPRHSGLETFHWAEVRGLVQGRKPGTSMATGHLVLRSTYCHLNVLSDLLDKEGEGGFICHFQP